MLSHVNFTSLSVYQVQTVHILLQSIDGYGIVMSQLLHESESGY